MIIFKGHRALALLSMLLITGCQSDQSPPPPAPTEVRVVRVEPKLIPANYEYVGFVRSAHDVEIRARISGYLDGIEYSEGEVVESGQLLFKIDPRSYEASLDSAKAHLEEQKAQLWNATRVVERLRSLYEQKAASRRDLDNAIASEKGYNAQVDASRAKVRQAELDLAFTTVYSPVKGIAGDAKVRIGTLVEAQQTLMTTVTAIDPVWVVFSISERQVLQSRQERKEKRLLFPKDGNFKIELQLSDGTIYPEAGKFDFLSPIFEQSTGTMMMRALFPNPEAQLNPGQFVRVKVIGAVRPNAIAVPQRAVLQSKEGPYLYVVDAEDRVSQLFVDLGEWYKSDWIINSGLKGGERVIIDGTNKVKVGGEVEVISEVTRSDDL